MVRLNKYIAECGICSRRSADNLIMSGKVYVNNDIVTNLGTKIDDTKDEVKINGKKIIKENKLVYIMLNKPKGYVTTSKEQFNRPSVLDLLDTTIRVYPIGRLDMYTEGLLLLTNDGEFANKMMHPKNKIKKTYIVKVKGDITDEKLENLRRGVDIGDYITRPASVNLLSKNEIKITISEGKNRQIRRMCSAINLIVLDLKRISIGKIKLGNLKLGKYRFLDKKELYNIK